MRLAVYTRMHSGLPTSLRHPFEYAPNGCIPVYLTDEDGPVAELKRKRVGAGLWTFSPRAAEGQGERAQMAGRGMVFKYRPPAIPGRRASQL
jgi:hypothetical protein